MQISTPTQLITKMLKYWEEGYDDVYARRRARWGESRLKKLTAKYFYALLQHSTDIPIQRDTGDFRLLSRKCILALRELRESDRFTKGMFSWIGFKKKEIVYDRHARAAGQTKWSYWKLLDFAIGGITSFTTAPLRFSTMLGAVTSSLAFIYIGYIILKALLFGVDVAGYPSLMAVILFLVCVQLLSLGIIGEYIGRIFNEFYVAHHTF